MELQYFGPWDLRNLREIVSTAYDDFLQWKRANKVVCSQKRFTPNLVPSLQNNVEFTSSCSSFSYFKKHRGSFILLRY